MTILDEIAAYARERVANDQKKVTLAQMQAQATALPRGDFAFMNSLRQRQAQGELAFICECKQASPSKGQIVTEFPYVEIAKSYEAAGADAISVLTEPKWFKGQDAFLQEIAATVATPCLRKDFVVDAYQIYQAKTLGAAAVLLICSILDAAQIRDYLQLCAELGLSALVEVHDEREISMALQAGAEIIGVNNRNLKDFTVDPNNSQRLRSLVPNEIIFVAESGIKGPEDIKPLAHSGVNAVLIGETLMRASDKGALLAQLRAAAL